MSVIWARHNVGSSWCAILTISGGSVQTYCRGRWLASDPYQESASPPHDERCGGCQRIVIDPVELGLSELIGSASEPLHISERFDLGEGEG